MTIIAAYEEGNKYWIASDSVGSDGSMKYEYGNKLISRGDYIIAFSWSYRVADIIKECKGFPQKLSGLKELRIIRDIIKNAILDDGLIGDDGNVSRRSTASGHPFYLVIISPSGIYTIENDYQIHKISTGYAAAGSGQEVATGSLYTSKKLKINGKKAIQLAVKAASELTLFCGGKCHVKSVEKKNASKK